MAQAPASRALLEKRPAGTVFPLKHIPGRWGARDVETPKAVVAGQSSAWTAVPLRPNEKAGFSFCQKKGSRLWGLGASWSSVSES